MLIPFPVAFWTGALFTDATGGLTHDPFWFRMSVALIAMGNIGGLCAAVAGYIDYRTVPLSAKARSLATGHLQWSLATMAAMLAALAFRLHDHASLLGIGLTITGSLLLFVGGFLGSELTNRHRIGVLEQPDREPAPVS
jgi:uncharacterized membrane protein